MATTESVTTTKYPGVLKTADGRFVVQAIIKVNGVQKRARKTMDAGATIGQTLAELEKMKEELRKPPEEILSPLLPDGSQTVEQYAKAWLEQKAKLLKPSAIASLENGINGFVIPRMGWMACKAVNRACVQSWVVWAQEQRSPRDGRLYANATLETWWRALGVMLRDMAADLRFEDPTNRVSPPSRPEQELMREQRTLTWPEITQLLDFAKEMTPDRYAEIACLALTGMRAGEMYAMKWDVVDFAAQTIVVAASISCGEWTPTTKTKAKRSVPLHSLVAEVLGAHRRDQLTKQNRKALASGLVFPSDVGTPRTANTLDKVFEALGRAMRTDVQIGAQVLRRSFNTNLVRANIDHLTVQAIMGHTSEQMTARYFGVAHADKAAAMSNVFQLPTAQR